MTPTTGNIVRWSTQGSMAYGRVREVVTNGSPTDSTGEFSMDATEDNPVLRVEVYRQNADGEWEPSDQIVLRRRDSLTMLDGVDSLPAKALRTAAGTAIKATEGGGFEGYLVFFGDNATKDLQGEYFTPDTDFSLDWYEQRPLIYHHGLHPRVKNAPVGYITSVMKDERGLFARGRFVGDDELADTALEDEARQERLRYVRSIERLVKAGELSFSSGSLAHLVETDGDGRIKRWPIVEGSATPTPAEPRGTGIEPSVKAALELLNISEPTADDATSKEPPAKENTLTTADTSTQLSTVKGSTKMEMNPEMVSAIRELVAEIMAEMKGDGYNDDEEMRRKMENAAEAEVAKMDDETKADDEKTMKRIAIAALNERERVTKARKSVVKAAIAEREIPQSSVPSSTSVKMTATGSITLRTPFEQAGWQTEDFSFAANFAGKGIGDVDRVVSAPEFHRAMATDALKRYQAGEIKLPDYAVKSLAAIKNGEVLGTGNSGFGDDHTPEIWHQTMWDKPRISNFVPNVFENVDMPSNPYQYPVEGSDPDIKFIAETINSSSLSLDAAAPAMPLAKIGDSKVTFTAKKLGALIPISAELNEDGILRLIPRYREQAERALMDAQDFVVLNGDVATTGNINADGETITASDRKYQAYNGLIKQALVTSTTTGIAVDASGATPTLALLRTVRAALDPNISPNPERLVLIVDPSTYVALLNEDVVLTRDKYGDQATVLTGELGRIDGMPVFVSAQMALADTDGKVTASGNGTDRGRALIVHRDSWFLGYRRQVNTTLTFVPYYDTHFLTMTLRNAFVGRTYNDSAQVVGDRTVGILYNIAV